MKSITSNFASIVSFAVALLVQSASGDFELVDSNPLGIGKHWQKHYSSNSQAISQDLSSPENDSWCNYESEALATCAYEETLKCMACSFRAFAENNVFSVKNVDDSIICDDLKKSSMQDDLLDCAAEACPIDCIAELHNHHNCLVQMTTGCDLHCSSGAKKEILLVPALLLLGTAVISWM